MWSIEEDAVTIRGERKQESEEKKKDFFRSERSYGSSTSGMRLSIDRGADFSRSATHTP
jgi:HSP20 family protein